MILIIPGLQLAIEDVHFILSGGYIPLHTHNDNDLKVNIILMYDCVKLNLEICVKQ